MTAAKSLKAGWILLFAGVLAKAIGAFYRLPLTNLLGAKGMGGYQLVFPVYALVLALTSSAMPLLLSRQIAKDGRFGYAVFRSGLKVLALTGVSGGVLLAALAYPLARLQGFPAMWWGYLALAPAVPLVAIAAAFRGWFAASLHAGTLATVSLVEQVVKLSGLLFAYLLSAKGLVWQTVGALLGVTVAEGASLAWLVVSYFAFGYRLSRPEVKVGFLPVWKASVPITASNMIAPLTQFADSMLLVNLLVLYGWDKGESVGLYGVWSGAVGTLLTAPVVLTFSFATMVVPALSKAKAQRDMTAIKGSSLDTLRTVLAISLPAAVGLALVAPRLVPVLYPALSSAERSLAVLLLTVGCASIPLTCLQQLYGAMLNALDRSETVVKHLLVAAGVKVALSLVLLRVGIVGATIANLIGVVLAFALNATSYYRLVGRFASPRRLWTVVGATAAMAAVIAPISYFFDNNIPSVVLCCLLGGAVYATILFATSKRRRALTLGG